MSEIRRFLRTRSFAFALLLSIVLLVANIAVLPSFGSPSNFDTNLMLFAPFALVAMAATPAILSGGGGLDTGRRALRTTHHPDRGRARWPTHSRCGHHRQHDRYGSGQWRGFAGLSLAGELAGPRPGAGTRGGACKRAGS